MSHAIGELIALTLRRQDGRARAARRQLAATLSAIRS